MRIVSIGLLAAASLIGCHVEIHETGEAGGVSDEESTEDRAAEVCDPYCIDLIECGALADTAFTSCRDLCLERFEEDEDAVTDGCECIQAAECNADAATHCEGDPLPGVLDDEKDDSDDSPPDDDECTGDDCPTSCVASCQCDQGEACINGVCETPADPVSECENDCDCTSGESCVDGTCQ